MWRESEAKTAEHNLFSERSRLQEMILGLFIVLKLQTVLFKGPVIALRENVSLEPQLYLLKESRHVICFTLDVV